jgi:hypothetical protein
MNDIGLSNDDLIALIEAVRSNSDMKIPFVDRSIGNTVPYTYAGQAAPYTVYDFPIGSDSGARLASVSISVDAIFQANYYWSLFIDGVTGPTGKNYEPFDPTVNTFEAVPASKFYILRPGARVQIKAYNAVSGNTKDGIISVFVAADLLTPAQWAMYSRFNSILNLLMQSSASPGSVDPSTASQS